MKHFGAWVVTAQSLKAYIEGRLEELTEKHGVNQEPDITGDVSDSMILAEDVTPQVVKVRVLAPPTERQLVVLDSADHRVASPELRGGKATVELIPNWYTFCAGRRTETLKVPTVTRLDVELPP